MWRRARRASPTFDLVTLGRLGQGLPVDGAQGTLQDDHLQLCPAARHHQLPGRATRCCIRSIAFWAIFIAFAIKLAVWPFHTWLPDAYAEAPTAGSILLSAVMSKMGAYGMLRIMLPLVPRGRAVLWPGDRRAGADWHRGGRVRRALVHWRRYQAADRLYLDQPYGLCRAGDRRRGHAQRRPNVQSRAIAINGAEMQMVAHGLSTGALFLLAGMLYQRTGTYSLREWGGLRRIMPMFAGVMGVAMFANLGLPGLAGFVGEFFIFRGTWASLPFFTLLATIGLIVSALALLQMYARIFNGPLNTRWSGLADMRVASREFLAAAPLLLALLILGIYPAPIMDLANHAATQLVNVFALGH